MKIKPHYFKIEKTLLTPLTARSPELTLHSRRHTHSRPLPTPSFYCWCPTIYNLLWILTIDAMSSKAVQDTPPPKFSLQLCSTDVAPSISLHRYTPIDALPSMHPHRWPSTYAARPTSTHRCPSTETISPKSAPAWFTGATKRESRMVWCITERI